MHRLPSEIGNQRPVQDNLKQPLYDRIANQDKGDIFNSGHVAFVKGQVAFETGKMALSWKVTRITRANKIVSPANSSATCCQEGTMFTYKVPLAELRTPAERFLLAGIIRCMVTGLKVTGILTAKLLLTMTVEIAKPITDTKLIHSSHQTTLMALARSPAKDLLPIAFITEYFIDKYNKIIEKQ